ncbi:NAD-dependent epimerase/dehydratase family protein [Catenulispora rubra]|uniref:NAD-dependent epimerase/dehydratase family protein n=1 Tax=Catenulispora rubra TaxID=280293 RepID=UPI00189282F8|nr:NAD-dependent epimerase/dehydratase family protein [Catenulispora rubra]
MTRRIAVTGASGFIGGAVTRAAVAAGHQVHAFGRRPASALDPTHLADAPYRRWDIAAGVLADPPEVDAVVHCAGSVTDFGRLADLRRTNVDGTAHVYDTFCGHPEHPGEGSVIFVHVSTASVYAPRIPTVNATETDAPPAHDLPDAYGRSKSEAEDHLRREGRTATILRPHAVYGPGDTTLLPRLLDAIRPTPLGPRLFATGDGRQRVSLTSVGNLAQACLLAATTPSEHLLSRRTFNITDAEPVTLDDALRAILKARSPKAVPIYLPYRAAYPIAATAEAMARAARLLTSLAGSEKAPKPPRLTRYAVRHLALERTLDISAAREILRYRPEPTSFEGAEDW